MRYPFWNLCVFLCSTHDPTVEFYSDASPSGIFFWDVIMFFFFFSRQDLDPYLAISFKNSRYHIWSSPKKGKYITVLYRLKDLNVHPYSGVSKYTSDAGFHVSLLAWQAHYDLKDPAGLAGFLIDSDIKLVRAESGSSDESIRHKSSRRHEKKWDAQNEEKDKVSNYRSIKVIFFRCVVLFFSHLE